jgi:hypothetical protein
MFSLAIFKVIFFQLYLYFRIPQVFVSEMPTVLKKRNHQLNTTHMLSLKKFRILKMLIAEHLCWNQSFFSTKRDVYLPKTSIQKMLTNQFSTKVRSVVFSGSSDITEKKNHHKTNQPTNLFFDLFFRNCVCKI